MKGFLRRIFGKPSIYADGFEDDCLYDADTQELIYSSFDLLELMLQKGEQIDVERMINHFFVGEPLNVDRAAALFENWGFLVGMKEEGRLHIVERAVPSKPWVEAMIPLMCRTAGEFDLEYDGWDCGSILPANAQIFIK